MAKQLTALAITAIEEWKFGLDSDGKLNRLMIGCVVNYSDRVLSETMDLWPLLTTTQKNSAQNIYDAVKSKLTTALL